jgi:3-oxoacyl-[acyl-carrier protein] reductase
MAIDSAVQKWALITGAGSGMGWATAERFLRGGWGVLALDKAEASITALASAHEGAVIAAVVDIVERGAVKEAIERSGIAPRLFAALNVAGVYPPTSLDDYSDEKYSLIFDINVLGTLNVASEAISTFRLNGTKGAVVNFASVDAFTPKPAQLLYAASKAAVVSLTRSLAATVAAEDIIVNAVAPGWVNTPGNQATGRMVGAEAKIPLGRIAHPDEIAEWVYALGSRETLGYMTGETIRIAGGMAGS